MFVALTEVTVGFKAAVKELLFSDLGELIIMSGVRRSRGRGAIGIGSTEEWEADGSSAIGALRRRPKSIKTLQYQRLVVLPWMLKKNGLHTARSPRLHVGQCIGVARHPPPDDAARVRYFYTNISGSAGHRARSFCCAFLSNARTQTLHR